MFFGLSSLSTIFFARQEDVKIKILKEASQIFLTLKSLKSSSRLSFSGTDSRWSKATRVLWKRKHKETKHYEKFINTLRTQLLKTSCTIGISSSSCRFRESNKNRYNSYFQDKYIFSNQKNNFLFIKYMRCICKTDSDIKILSG